MRIVNVQTFEVVLPMAESLLCAPVSQDTGNYVVVKVFTDEDVVGFGEATCPYNHSAAVKAVIDHELIHLLLDEDPGRIEYLLAKMEAVTRTWYKREGAFATSGLEMALWDIKSKTCGVPLYEVLGGSFRTRVPYSGYLFINTPEENAQKAREYVRQGYTTLKLKVGRDIEQDLEMLNQLRKEVGHRIHIRVDANQAWLVSEAIRNIRKMEKFNISNVEQPVAFDDIDGMYEIRRSVETPIVADESCFTIDDAMQLANRRAADILLIRIEEAGGIINTKKILGIAEAAKMPCIMGTWNESELNTMAKVAVIASSKNFPYANDTVLPFFDAGLSQEGLDLTRPYIDVSEKPGLGVTLSESALKRYSVFR